MNKYVFRIETWWCSTINNKNNVTIHDNFIKFEEDRKLFLTEIQGVKIWHYIRLNVFASILKEKYHLEHTEYSMKHFSKLKRAYLLFKKIPNMIFKNPVWFVDQKDLLVFCHPRRVKNDNGYYECIYTDELLRTTEYSYLATEHIYWISGDHFKPVLTNNLTYYDYVDFIRVMKKLFMITTFRFKIKQSEYELIEGIIDDLNHHMNTSIKKEAFIRTIKNSIYSYYASIPTLSKMLDNIKPKIIIETASYSFSSILINELAKRRGIKTIELQHGFMGRQHLGYNFPRNLSYLEGFPDHIFLYGDYWKESIRVPLEENRLKVTGFPYFDSIINKYKIIDRKRNYKTIIFISQSTIGKQLSKIAVELSDLLDDKFLIYYKLHPGEYDHWKEKYPWLCMRNNLEVLDNNYRSIYYYFRLSDYQIGVYSTALFEGMGFGLKTFLLNLPPYNSFHEKIMKNN